MGLLSGLSAITLHSQTRKREKWPKPNRRRGAGPKRKTRRRNMEAKELGPAAPVQPAEMPHMTQQKPICTEGVLSEATPEIVQPIPVTEPHEQTAELEEEPAVTPSRVPPVPPQQSNDIKGHLAHANKKSGLSRRGRWRLWDGSCKITTLLRKWCCRNAQQIQ